MADPRYPSLYQINSRVWLTELSHTLGRPATLDDIPDTELNRIAEMGFDRVWFLSIWQTGLAVVSGGFTQRRKIRPGRQRFGVARAVSRYAPWGYHVFKLRTAL